MKCPRAELAIERTESSTIPAAPQPAAEEFVTGQRAACKIVQDAIEQYVRRMPDADRKAVETLAKRSLVSSVPSLE